MHTTLHTIVYLSINVAIGAGLLTMSTLAPTTAHAEEVSWNEQVAARAFRDNVFGDDTTNSGFWIREPHVTLRYRAFVRNATTGEIIPPNGTVAAGTPLELVFDEHQTEDAYWFAVGGKMDTPYGYWRRGRTAPPIACQAQDLFHPHIVDRPDLSRQIGGDMFAAMSVAPPSKTIEGTSNLSCGTTATDGSQNCMTTTPGRVPLEFVFAETTGSFYPRTRPDVSDVLATGVCYGSNVPLMIFRTYDDYNGPGGPTSPFVDNGGTKADPANAQLYYTVPTQTIDYPITVTAAPPADGPTANTPPNTPSISNFSGACVVGDPHSMVVTATDPDGDNIRYAIDWDDNGTIDMFAPSSGYMNSGQSQTITRNFAIAGNKTIQVRAQDTNGAFSNWRSYTFDCATAPDPFDSLPPVDNTLSPTVSEPIIRATPNPVRQYDDFELSWDPVGNTGCELSDNIPVTSNVSSAGDIMLTAQRRTLYTIECDDDQTATADVRVIPIMIET